MLDSDIRHRTLYAPQNNQDMVVGAVDVVRDAVRRFYGNRDEQSILEGRRHGFCGVYLVGSYAAEEGVREWGRNAPDVDLLIVDRMTFAHSKFSLHRSNTPHLNGNHIAEGIADMLDAGGFDLAVPRTLPTRYNIGHIGPKWLMRATPHQDGVLPMDFNMVNLNGRESYVELSAWLADKDVDEQQQALPRVPLLEVQIVAQ
ncbi:MAG TPA: hypothetical protein VM124_03810 [Candidatus Limnocylindrales bacterium]|nr:hypothetical protein [Candidatus Limnocylindrales bacterium]